MARNHILRFRVTTSDGRCSDVWRAWSAGNNMYLAPRMKGGEFKISLHESGKWRLAFTRQYAERMGRLGTWDADRKIEVLNCLPERATGFTRAVRMYFLYSELRIPGTSPQESGAIIQVPGPPKDGIRVVDLVFTTPDSRFTKADPPPGRSLAPEAIATWKLPNGETFWGVHFELAGLRGLDRECEQFRLNLAKAGTRLDDRSRLGLNDPSGRIMIAGANDQGWFCVIDAASC